MVLLPTDKKELCSLLLMKLAPSYCALSQDSSIYVIFQNIKAAGSGWFDHHENTRIEGSLEYENR